MATTAIALLQMRNEPVKVSDMIGQQSTTLEKLANSGDNIVPSGYLNAATTRNNNLKTLQDGMKNGPAGHTDLRNDGYALMKKDRESFMSLVQTRANDLNNVDLARALIARNGFGLKKDLAPRVLAEISAKNKKDESGTVQLRAKKPNTHRAFSIDWAYSTNNGQTWITVQATGVCKREVTGLPSGAKIIFRRRITIGTTVGDWEQTSPLTIL